MVDLPKKKVGIVACSGEELPEGTVTRLAALKLLEQLRPADTVTICLPLFLAGGQGDRAFAKFYPTIAVDGCELRCASRATELYSSKPAATVKVRDLIAERGIRPPEGKRRLNAAGLQAVDAVAESMGLLVDELLGRGWNRSTASFESGPDDAQQAQMGDDAGKVATCSCGSGIPVGRVEIEGKETPLIALTLIFEQFRAAGKPASGETGHELLEAVKIYNPIPDTERHKYEQAVLEAYSAFCTEEAHR